MSQLLVEALPVLEKVLGFTCRRYHLKKEEAEDFASFVKVRLVEREEAVLRSFRRESSLGTFLSVIVSRMLIDFRRKRDVPASSLDAIDGEPAAPPVLDPVAQAEDLVQAHRVHAALREAIGALPELDRRIVELHFTEDLPVSKVALTLGLEAKPLYRRIVKILGQLRGRLQAAGIRPEQVRSLTGRPEVGIGFSVRAAVGNLSLDPSKER